MALIIRRTRVGMFGCPSSAQQPQNGEYMSGGGDVIVLTLPASRVHLNTTTHADKTPGVLFDQCRAPQLTQYVGFHMGWSVERHLMPKASTRQTPLAQWGVGVLFDV